MTAKRIRDYHPSPAPRASRAPLLSAHEIIAPGCGSPDLLTQSKPRPVASAADLATPPLRPTSEDALDRPSRIGNKLHWRDGRVTDFQHKD